MTKFHLHFSITTFTLHFLAFARVSVSQCVTLDVLDDFLCQSVVV